MFSVPKYVISISVDDRDPVWRNEIIKSKIKGKNVLYKKYISNGRLK